MNLKDVLIEKGKKDSLGHFYILETAENEAIAFDSLLKFTENLISDYYQKVEGAKPFQNLFNHPDVFVLGSQGQKDEEEKEASAFTVLEAGTLSRFFEFRSVQAKRKFAIITEAHRINPTIANKWLKLLEEPQGSTTIFILNPRRSKLLDTIHSRAIHLRLPSTHQKHDKTEWMEFLKSTKNLALSEFIEKYSKGERDLSFWVGELISWESEQSDQSEAKSALENWIKLFGEMETFHQPTATKWTLFYHHIQTYVMPRHLL